MQIVLFVAVIAVWFPAARELSGFYVRICGWERKETRCFQTFKYLKTERGTRCIDEQRFDMGQQKRKLLLKWAAWLQFFSQHVGRWIPAGLKGRYRRRHVHVLFMPEYGKKELFDLYQADIRGILGQICMAKGIRVLKLDTGGGLVRMRIRVSPEENILGLTKYLKAESTVMLYQKYDTLKHRFANERFWSRGTYVSTAGLDKDKVRRFVWDQRILDFAANEQVARMGNAL